MLILLVIFSLQDEDEVETTIKDHQLLRSFTKEIFTSEVDLLDVGFLLDLHPTMVKQKLWDYPRSIETASYMVVSEWWDSFDSSREEKYGMLCDAVHSIGKKCTAQRLRNLVVENTLSPQPQATGCFQHQAVNSSALARKSGPHLAICTNSSAIVHEGIGTSSNTDNTSEGDEGVRSDSGDLSYNSSRMVPPAHEISRADEITGRGKNVSDVKAVSVNDTDVFETVGDADVSGEARSGLGVEVSRSNQSGEIDNGNSKGKEREVSFCGTEYSNDQLAHSQTHYAQVNSFNEESIVVEEKKESKRDSNSFDIETVHKREIKLKSEMELSWLEPNDIDKHPDVSPDSGLFELFGESVCDSGPDDVNYQLPEIKVTDEVSSQLLNTTRKEHAAEATRFDNIKWNFGISPKYRPTTQNLSSPVANGQAGVENCQAGPTGVVNDQAGVVNGLIGVTNGQRSVLNGKTGVVKAQTLEVNNQTGVGNGQAVVLSDQTYVMNNQTLVVSDQTVVVNGQTGVENGQKGIVNDQKDVMNDQTVVVNGQTGVENGQKGIANDQKDVMNDQTVVVNYQTGVVNGQTGVVNGQAGVVNGQTGVVNGQTGVVNGQTSDVNGQTGVVNDQTGVVNGQAGVRDDQILEQNTDVHGIKRGFFQRMLGFFWRKRTRKVKEARVEFDSDDQPVWEIVNIPDSYCLLEKYPSDDAEAW